MGLLAIGRRALSRHRVDSASIWYCILGMAYLRLVYLEPIQVISEHPITAVGLATTQHLYVVQPRNL